MADNGEKQDEFEDDFNDDDELNEIREQRLKQMKTEMAKRQKYLGELHHGEYREIKEDAFLKEVTSSEWVVVHFYHKEFTRCKIIDKHLSALAKTHIETKFITIDVEKAPFFVGKLQVKVLPALILFKDGNAVDRIVGFDELGGTDNFKSETLARRIAQGGVLNFK